MRWRCRWFHRMVSFMPISQQAERYTCSCGKKYAVNHAERMVMRWEDAEPFYRTFPGTLPHVFGAESPYRGATPGKEGGE